MLEKEIGINQFSIYASFKNKRGVLRESLRCYRDKMKRLMDKLEASPDGVAAIRAYCYDFLEFAAAHRQTNGCLIHNTLGEMAHVADSELRSEIMPFVEPLARVLREKLASDTGKDAATLDRQVNYLLVGLQGMTTGIKIFDRQQIEDFVETTCDKL